MNEQDKPTGQTYEIRSVSDFFQLTPRQREHAANDFLLFVRYVGAAEMASQFSGGLFRMTTDTSVFRWIDDGEHIATMNFKDHNNNDVGGIQRDHGDEFKNGGNGE